MRKRNYKKTKTKSELHTHTYNTIDERGKLLRIFQATNREGGTRTRERAFSFESLEYIKGWRAGRFCCRRDIYWVGKERDLSDIFFFCSTVASFLRYHRETLPFLFFASLCFASHFCFVGRVGRLCQFRPHISSPPFSPLLSPHRFGSTTHRIARPRPCQSGTYPTMDGRSLAAVAISSVGRSVSQSVSRGTRHDMTWHDVWFGDS